jgi:biopolymer transport protein ExbD
MLDVVMIMLIFFIVAGSFVREVVIEVERKPTSSAESDKPSENIIIQVAADDDIWIKGRRIDGRSVRANISRLRAENPKAAVIIKANNKSRVRTIAAVVNSAREAGIYNVSLSTGD